jgi:polyisoprenoid-binding protein YceI
METSKENKTGTKWVTDPAHSELMFKVKHLMITNVKGEFKDFTAEINGDDFRNASVKASIDTSSVFTNSTDRDNHLRSADFFDVENHPTMTFESTSFKKLDDDRYKLKGRLKIKEVSNEVELDVEFGGIIKDPWGQEKAGFSFEGKINRRDWGLNWNAALESGGVLVSDEVKLSGEVQFARQAVTV